MTRLKKANVEALLRDFDCDPVAALTAALRVLLDRPAAEWDALLSLASLPATRHDRLLAGDPAALDELAAELNETRQIAR